MVSRLIATTRRLWVRICLIGLAVGFTVLTQVFPYTYENVMAAYSALLLLPALAWMAATASLRYWYAFLAVFALGWVGTPGSIPLILAVGWYWVMDACCTSIRAEAAEAAEAAEVESA